MSPSEAQALEILAGLFAAALLLVLATLSALVRSGPVVPAAATWATGSAAAPPPRARPDRPRAPPAPRLGSGTPRAVAAARP